MPTIDLLIKKIYRNVFMIEAKLLRLNSIRKNNSFNIVLSDNDERAELYEIMTIKHLIIKVGQTVPKVSLLIESIIKLNISCSIHDFSFILFNILNIS